MLSYAEQVFDRRSTICDEEIISVRHGFVNLDASGSERSCDGSLAQTPCYTALGLHAMPQVWKAQRTAQRLLAPASPASPEVVTKRQVHNSAAIGDSFWGFGLVSRAECRQSHSPDAARQFPPYVFFSWGPHGRKRTHTEVRRPVCDDRPRRSG